MTPLPQSVRIREVGPRDGFQNEPEVIATDDKDRVIALIERIEGLRGVDAGRLEMARITESLTALLISINARHKAHAGIRITGL